MASLGRAASQKRIKKLMERGFHRAGDVENRLGFHVGQLGDWQPYCVEQDSYMIRKARAVWHGTGRGGGGKLSSEFPAWLDQTPYSFGIQFEMRRAPTRKSWLQAGACRIFHDGAGIRAAGGPLSPTELSTEAAVTLEAEGKGFRIGRSALALRGKVPNFGCSGLPVRRRRVVRSPGFSMRRSRWTPSWFSDRRRAIVQKRRAPHDPQSSARPVRLQSHPAGRYRLETVSGVSTRGAPCSHGWPPRRAGSVCRQGESARNGSILMPHKHPEDRIYTVMSGVFYIGLGETFDGGVVNAYPPGSVIVLPGENLAFPLGEVRRIRRAGDGNWSARPRISRRARRSAPSARLSQFRFGQPAWSGPRFPKRMA